MAKVFLYGLLCMQERCIEVGFHVCMCSCFMVILFMIQIFSVAEQNTVWP